MQALLLHIPHQRTYLHAFRDEQGEVQQVRYPYFPLVGKGVEDVFAVKDAFDVRPVLIVYRISRKVLLSDLSYYRLGRIVYIESDHLGCRHYHTLDRYVCETEDAVDKFLF